MTEEMFVRILELVGQAGEGGYSLALVYLIYAYFSSLTMAGTILGSAWLIAKTIRTTMNEGRVLQEVAELVGQSYYGDISSREGRSIIAAIKKAIDAGKNHG